MNEIVQLLSDLRRPDLDSVRTRALLDRLNITLLDSEDATGSFAALVALASDRVFLRNPEAWGFFALIYSRWYVLDETQAEALRPVLRQAALAGVGPTGNRSGSMLHPSPNQTLYWWNAGPDHVRAGLPGHLRQKRCA